jgi:hypothetical protein
MEQQIGIDEEKKNIWNMAIKQYHLDDDLKKDVNLIKIQSKNVINSAIDRNKYQGIVDNL